MLTMQLCLIRTIQNAFATLLCEDTSLKLILFIFLLKASEELLINFGVTSNPEKSSK